MTRVMLNVGSLRESPKWSDSALLHFWGKSKIRFCIIALMQIRRHLNEEN